MNVNEQPPRLEEPADAQVGFWDRLSHNEQIALQAAGWVSVFQAGTTICAEGEQATDVLVLAEGWVKILSVTRTNDEVFLALRGRGDIIGELAGKSAGYRTAKVVAMSLVRALAITHEEFTRVLGAHPGVGVAYELAAGQRKFEVPDMLRSRSADNGAQRLAALLLDLAGRYGIPAESGIIIDIPLSQVDFASLIGASRATVTRALGTWRRSGLVDTAHRRITIKSAAGLRSVARLLRAGNVATIQRVIYGRVKPRVR